MNTISIKGRKYVTVNERIKAFRSDPRFEGYALITKVHELNADACAMEAQIFDKDGRMLANGFAREIRNAKDSLVNATSYVENCETSAWGRALGNLGIGIDESICSAQELLNALIAQESAKQAQQVNNTPQPQNTPKTQETEQSDDLTDREQDEYLSACADMDAAESREALEKTYMRYKDARFAKLLGIHAAAICKRKGWEKKDGKVK